MITATGKPDLREMCPNTELFLVRKEISVFSPNTGKYGPKITPYLDTFHAVIVSLTTLKLVGSSIQAVTISKAGAYVMKA